MATNTTTIATDRVSYVEHLIYNQIHQNLISVIRKPIMSNTIFVIRELMYVECTRAKKYKRKFVQWLQKTSYRAFFT